MRVHPLGRGLAAATALDVTLQGQKIQIVSTGGRTYIRAPASLHAAQNLPAAVAVDGT